MRAILFERGIVVPKGRATLQRRLVELLDANEEHEVDLITSRMRILIEDMRVQWRELDHRINAFEEEFVHRAREDAMARRLMSVPGIGVMNATALIAAIGTGEAFRRGRDLAAWLGLVPRQITTGGRPRLVGISKRGNKYLRELLIHGARSVLPTLLTSTTRLGEWLRGLMARAHKNTVVVALASKLARIAWAVLRHADTFDAKTLARAA